MDIGIIGAGNIGGTLGRHLVKAGHRVKFGVRNTAATGPLLADLGDPASVGTAADAAKAGSIVIFAGPFGAWPGFAEENAKALNGKLVIDAANPYANRDGAIADDVAASGRGSGAFVARLLPDSKVVKAFNTIYWMDLRDQAGRDGERLAMPIAGDDEDGVARVADLAEAIGFDPIVVGGLAQSARIDPDSPIYAKSMTAAQVRATLDLD